MTTPDRHRRAFEIFTAACDVLPSQRDELVSRECGADASLRRQVEDLLKRDADAAGRIDGPAVPGLQLTGISGTDPEIIAPLPRTIGPFRVVGRLGSGGMGVVYEAVQDHPLRRVAVKVIRPGVATPAALRRFDYEANVLARLQHPGIAQIYEAGAAEIGGGPQPYFAMELVKGQPVTTYVEEHRLSVPERLDLLRRICDAVHHAHQRGVIHRDLKPGNVLVDETGQPKILDFGVARAIDSELQHTTGQADIGRLIGTVPYMSPEQVAGDPNAIDIRSDVYALGVLGYELLAGRLPYDISDRMVHEACRAIREDDPTPLSSVSRVFRGDVETIIAKALEKDPARRYPAASDLSSDIQRFLRREPIAARPRTVWYQVVRFTQKHRAITAAALLVVLALIGALTISLVSLSRESRARHDEQVARNAAEDAAKSANLYADRERKEAERSRTMTNLLLAMLSTANPHLSPAPNWTVREMLDYFVQVDLPTVTDRTDIRVELLSVVGNAYRGLAEFSKAEPLLSEAVSLASGLEPRLQSRALQGWADYLHDQGRHRESASMLRRALKLLEDSDADSNDVVSLLGDLSDRAVHLGDAEEAVRMANRGVELAERGANTEETTAMAYTTLARALKYAGRTDRAITLHRKAVAILRSQGQQFQPHLTASLNDLAVALSDRGKTAEAQATLGESLQIARRIYGEHHPVVATGTNNLGMMYVAQRRFAEAEPLLRESLAIFQRNYPDEHEQVAQGLHNLGGTLVELERYQEAEPMLVRALAMRRRLLTTDSRLTATTIDALASLMQDTNRLDEAERFYVEALDVRRRTAGEESLEAARGMNNLASLYVEQGRFHEAEPLARHGLEIRRSELPADHPSLASSLSVYGKTLEGLHRLEEAALLLEECVSILAARLPKDEPTLLHQRIHQASVLATMGRGAEAGCILVNVLAAVGGSTRDLERVRAAAIRELLSLGAHRPVCEP